MKKFALVTLIGLFLLALPIHGAIDLVHQFAPSNIQGFHPLVTWSVTAPTSMV